MLGSSLPLNPHPSELCASPGTPRPEMAGKDSSRCLLLLAAVLMVESSQLGNSRAKLNSIKSSLGGETPAQAANRSAGIYQGLAFGGSKKGKNLGQVGKPSQYTPQPGELGTCALGRTLCPGAPQSREHSPRWGARGRWGGDPCSWVCAGKGAWVAAGPALHGKGGLVLALTWALGQGHVLRASAFPWRKAARTVLPQNAKMRPMEMLTSANTE